MRVNAVRLLRRLDELSRIGAIPGNGVCRLAFSREDKAGRDFIERLMKELGLRVSIDAIGNIIGVREGKRDGPIVLTGSHTDTVATGGRFDGSLGVLAGLEALERMNEEQIETTFPVGVVSFVNEEGVRFMPDMMGSLFLRGDLSVDEIRRIEGVDGTSIGANLDTFEFPGTGSLQTLDIGQFIELHIEQGPRLESSDIPIGVVDRVQGLSWLEITFLGTANHAGTTPMVMRKDAGYAAGELARQVRILADNMGGEQRATVGSIRLSPNLINVIAEEAIVTVDLRNPDIDALDESERQVLAMVSKIAETDGLRYHTKKLAGVAPEMFNPTIVEEIEKAATNLGYKNQRITSGASHDAQILASLIPTAMIFVPSKGGISHNVKEYTTPEHVEAGANVLLATLLKLASDA